MQEVDFIAADVTVNRARHEVVDFMTPFWEDSLTFMVKAEAPDRTSYTGVFEVRFERNCMNSGTNK